MQPGATDLAERPPRSASHRTACERRTTCIRCDRADDFHSGASLNRKRILFACDLDSQVFGALPLALAFRARGWTVAFSIHGASELSDTARNTLGDRFDLMDGWLGELAVSRRVYEFDAVGVYATGSRIARFRHDIALAARVRGGPRPALICGFNGLVYEKFEEGLAWRLGYDQICLNGPRDHDAFKDFIAGTPFEAQSATIVGLRRRTDAPAPSPKPATGGPQRFVFAEQVIVPADPQHRAALVATLARLAQASPGWLMTIKVRVRPDERTFHDQVAPIAALLDALPSRPANLELSYAPLDGLLATADLFGTVSSTALFDAMDRGVPSCVATDFGVRNAYGSHVLFGSGLTVALSDCADLDQIPRRTADPRWLDRVGYGPQHTPDALIAALERFDGSSPFQPQAQSLETSATLRGPVPPVGTAAITAGRAAVEAALAAGDRDDALHALERLGATLGQSDSRHADDSAWRRREGALAAFARRRKLYWLYRTVRNAVLGARPR